MPPQTNKKLRFSQEEMEHISSIITNMISIKYDEYTFKWSHSLRLIEQKSVYTVIFSTLLTILSAFYIYISSDNSFFMRAIVIFGHLTYTFSSISYIVSATIIIVQLHRHHSSHTFAAINSDASNNIEYLQKLSRFTKPTLEWYLLHYRHHWECIDKRVALRIGDLPKIGLLPALMAASVVASTLIKYESNIVLWTPMIIFCLFYIVGFFNSNNRNRHKQAIAVLEYTIAHMTDQKQHEPYSPRFINKGKCC